MAGSEDTGTRLKAISKVIGSCDWGFYDFANDEYPFDLLDLCESTPMEASQILGSLHNQYLFNQNDGTTVDPADPSNLSDTADSAAAIR